MVTKKSILESESSGVVKIPAIINNQNFTSKATSPVTAVDGTVLAELTLTPLIKTNELRRIISEKFRLLQGIPVSRILKSLKKGAALLRGDDWNFSRLSKQAYCKTVSKAIGLPFSTMVEEVDEIADLLDHLEEIVSVQLPSSIKNALDNHEFCVNDYTVGYYPAGKSLLVKVPGNIPTICIYWLVPLAQKRPIILVPPTDEPFTHLLLLEVILHVDPALASCIQFLPCEEKVWTNLLKTVDQIIIPESLMDRVTCSSSLAAKTHYIHYGRTKLLIAEDWNEEAVNISFRRMTWKNGRTCTGLTSVIVNKESHKFCELLAKKICTVYGCDFSENLDRLPMFQIDHARRLNEVIEGFVSIGDAEDMTWRIRGGPRMLEVDGQAMFLPTVLWVQQKSSKAFGLELPFPFLSVSETSDEDEMIEMSKNSLIVSVITKNKVLIKRLCFESSIFKVFSGAQLERGYNYLDPHEGYLADFLNQKKAVVF